MFCWNFHGCCDLWGKKKPPSRHVFVFWHAATRWTCGRVDMRLPLQLPPISIENLSLKQEEGENLIVSPWPKQSQFLTTKTAKILLFFHLTALTSPFSSHSIFHIPSEHLPLSLALSPDSSGREGEHLHTLMSLLTTAAVSSSHFLFTMSFPVPPSPLQNDICFQKCKFSLFRAKTCVILCCYTLTNWVTLNYLFCCCTYLIECELVYSQVIIWKPSESYE